jgi:hypothetical protein
VHRLFDDMHEAMHNLLPAGSTRTLHNVPHGVRNTLYAGHDLQPRQLLPNTVLPDLLLPHGLVCHRQLCDGQLRYRQLRDWKLCHR